MTALVIASFDRAAPFAAAIARTREADRTIVGLWSPIPVDVPGAATVGGRGIAGIMAVAGVAGALLLYLLIWWSAVHAYAFDSGGRPLHSWPAVLVAPVELGVLVAGINGVVAFLVRGRMTRLNDAAFDFDEVEAAARDRFVMAVRCDPGADAAAVVATLGAAGAVHSRVIGQ